MNTADAELAHLRRAFAQAADLYGRSGASKQKYQCKTCLEKCSACKASMEAWAILYEAFRDTEGGLKVLAELERLKEVPVEDFLEPLPWPYGLRPEDDSGYSPD